MSLQYPNLDTYTIAFYNTENLFDVKDDPLILDDGFLENSKKGWNTNRYEKKITRIGMAISKIGFNELQKPPTLIGLAEVENDAVLEDLVRSTNLKDYNYGFVHYDSPDERGIDVALLYDKNDFTIIDSTAITLFVESEFGVRDYTRDILKVSGYLKDEKIHILVNHWPSRHVGSDTTGHKRMFAANKIIELIDAIRLDDPDAKVIIMGDFNDTPRNSSVQFLKNKGGLYNPMEKLMSYSRGSTNHKFKWILFDQILMTSNFLDQDHEGLKFIKAEIFDEKFLTQNYGKYKGQPWRTYESRKYKGGYSDHFPVYVQLKH